ncbi:hypothetical protein YOLOSWAG_297 [Erwinia phage vB_EamM_Yoloswag]|uniref:Uncharacterized protein n=1 Tax=Erwinia phage vB_EamM_Yoloswag TaxID=1958956 RepID=A0A1S6L3L3_9CAUD|nr:hypothetical protein HOR66_gp297 [Erwinia phage vB_EamM_Yoloswag]AQT28767.1 hypothetical protein YOLOSWAG_297 [Erwinia phage vB_EamM_Yoloswag]
MKINLEDLYTVQCELLKPFSPSQEFALINLLLENVDDNELEKFGHNVVHAYPHLDRLYSGFVNASQNVSNVVPFAVPVTDSDHAMEDLLHDSEGQLSLAPDLIAILDQAFERIPEREVHVDELNFPVERTELAVGHIAQAAMSALRSGLAPIVVRASKDQRANRIDRLLTFKALGSVFNTDVREQIPESRWQRPQSMWQRAHIDQIVSRMSARQPEADYTITMARQPGKASMVNMLKARATN